MTRTAFVPLILILLVFVVVVVVIFNWPHEAESGRVVAQEKPVEPVTVTVEGGDMTSTDPVPSTFGPKVIVVEFTVASDGSVSLSNPHLVYGGAPNAHGLPDMFTLVLFDAAGMVVSSRPVWDPRWTTAWNDEQDRDPVILADEGEVHVAIRFEVGTESVAVFQGEERLTVLDLTELVATFCEKNREDPDCRQLAE